MYLGPHHFQIQNRYHEDLVDFAVANLGYEPHGLVGAALDEEALFNGTLSVLHARGVFPDGLSFDIPQSDPAPPERNIAEIFPPTRNEIAVFLAVPRRKPNGPNIGPADAGASQARFTADPQTVADEVNGRDQQSVELARKNLHLLLESEISEDVVRLPLARILRDGTGHYVADRDYAPPCLQITAFEGLSQAVFGLIEKLDQKSTELASWQVAPGSSASAFSAR
ncbi:MAG: type VI secretion system baseplate subunit TssK, partial [bacterium]|nr:type VI secretion system baseplate subunit TssK [bacterium]